MFINKKKEYNKNYITNNIAYKSYIDMKKKELDNVIDEQEKEIALMRDIIQKQKDLLKKYDEVLKKHGIDAYFSEDRTYIIALRDILKKVKEIIEKGNDVPDVYYNEIEADIASLYLWKEATKEEVVKIINSYGIYDVVANNIPRKLLLDDNIY
ncbi:MAG: hypothetical protein ACI4ON_04585 [Clostridia bacterium]